MNKLQPSICGQYFVISILFFVYLPDADQAVFYLTSGESSLRAIVLHRLTSREIEQIRNTKIGIRHVALIGDDLEQHWKTVSVMQTQYYVLYHKIGSLRTHQSTSGIGAKNCF